MLDLTKFGIGDTVSRAVSPWISYAPSAIIWRQLMKARFKRGKKYAKIAAEILYMVCK